MQTMVPKSEAEAVANGAQLLDKKHPGWWNHIDTDRLRISSIIDCVCGQLDVELNKKQTPYWSGFAGKLIGATELNYWCFGFTVGPWEEDTLNDEWRLAILARREADKITTIERVVARAGFTLRR